MGNLYKRKKPKCSRTTKGLAKDAGVSAERRELLRKGLQEAEEQGEGRNKRRNLVPDPASKPDAEKGSWNDSKPSSPVADSVGP